MKACFELESGRLGGDPGELGCLENDSVLIWYDGRLRAGEEALLKAPGGEPVDGAFWGPYLFLCLDKRAKSLSIRTHFFGFGRNLYYSLREGRFFMAGSLLELKALTGMAFELDSEVLDDFFSSGFLAGERTLLKGVFRVWPGSNLLIGREGIERRPAASAFSSPEGEDAVRLYERALTESTEAAVLAAGSSPALALSGGYDSNSILYRIKWRWPKKQLHAYSVGGVKGIDETGTASEIASSYEGVSFKRALVGPGSEAHLDEITAILEGSGFERGIFLQYELAKLLSENGEKAVLCGECADQVFHCDSYRAMAAGQGHYAINLTPREGASGIILMKSRMMMNAFGIEPFYPYLSPDVLRSGCLTRAENGWSKAFHVSRCEALLPESLLERIHKKGGSTDLCALLPEGFDLTGAIRKNRFYSPKRDPDRAFLPDTIFREELLEHLYFSMRYLESFEKQFCDHPEKTLLPCSLPGERRRLSVLTVLKGEKLPLLKESWLSMSGPEIDFEALEWVIVFAGCDRAYKDQVRRLFTGPVNIRLLCGTHPLSGEEARERAFSAAAARPVFLKPGELLAKEVRSLILKKGGGEKAHG